MRNPKNHPKNEYIPVLNSEMKRVQFFQILYLGSVMKMAKKNCDHFRKEKYMSKSKKKYLK